MRTPREAAILHADVDAFFASVAQRDDPGLRGRPVIVGPGVVMAASYEAKACGVRGGMGAARARRLCPEAVFVRSDFDAYSRASSDLFGVFRDLAPLVEGLGLEEAFLDVSGLGRISGSPPAIAERLRRRVGAEVGLPISVGVARTKVLAKMASKAAKPDGLVVVEPGREREFLLPLPIETIWGVGKASAARLHAHGVLTVRDATLIPETLLISILGVAAGRHVHAIVHGHDRRRVRSGRPGRGSFGAQSALGRGRHTEAELHRRLARLADRVTSRMRRAGRSGRTVTLRLRFGDYARATRSSTLTESTAASAVVLSAAGGLLDAALPLVRRRGITLIGLAVSGLDSGAGGTQLALALPPRGGSDLDRALDEVHERFGARALVRGTAPDRF